jgi:uncharacterized protein (TIGR02996 family)
MIETLLQALHHSADDPVAWLALADALEEQDDPRAELVRLTNQLREELPSRTRTASTKRVQALLADGLRPCMPTVIASYNIHLTLIPPGKFLMGAKPREWTNILHERPQHQVLLTRPFYIGTYLITQSQYRAVMRSNPSTFLPNPQSHYDVPYDSTDNFPVDGVSYEMAVEFCKRLSARKAEKQARRVYRLPTEAEWEYACRAGTQTIFAYGNQLTSDLANFDGNYAHPKREAGNPTYHFRPSPVGSYRPNAFGLYDMHGNLWEWCSDWYDRNTYTATLRVDPTGPESGEHHVLRGGSWIDAGWNCRSATRSEREASHYVGLRVVADVAP